MEPEKLEFSLRLRHDSAGLSQITKDLGLPVRFGWDKGDPNRTLRGEPSAGTRDRSYRLFDLCFVRNTFLSDALGPCLQKLAPHASVLQAFVSSGGTAVLAIAWFSNAPASGGTIPSSIIAELARLNLTLDLYLYLGESTSTVDETPAD